MKKTNPSTLTADWSTISYPAPWQYITSAQLAKVLGVHLQTINNWVVRGILKPEPRSPQRRGNKNYFRVGAVQSWLSGESENDIVREWVKREVHNDTITDGQITWLLLSAYKTLWQFA